MLYLSHGFQPAVEKAIDERARREASTRSTALALHRRRATRTSGSTRCCSRGSSRRIGAALGTPGASDGARERSCRGSTASTAPASPHCRRRELVTTHAAFGYLAARYRLTQVAITGIEPEAEPSAQTLADLVDAVRRDHVTTVFVEQLVSPRLADTVAREAGATTAVLDPIEGLTDGRGRPRRRLLHADAPQPRHAAEGARMPLALELDGVDFAYTRGRPVLTGVEPARRGGRVRRDRRPERRRQDDAAAARARPRAADRAGACCSSASRPRRSATARGSATSPSARASARTRRRPCARWSRPAARRCGRSAGSAARTAPPSPRRSSASASPTARGGRCASCRAASSSARSSPRRSPRSRRCSCSTSRPPASTSARRSALADLLEQLRNELGVTILYVSHEFGAVEHVVQRLVLVRERIVFDGPPGELPGHVARPLPRTSMLDLEFMRLAFAAGAIVGRARARGRLLPRAARAEPDRRRDRPRRVRRRRGRLPARRLARADRARGGRDRRDLDRVAARPQAHGRRPGARDRLLHRHRRGRRARLVGGRAEREPVPVPLRLDPDGDARRPRC